MGGWVEKALAQSAVAQVPYRSGLQGRVPRFGVARAWARTKKVARRFPVVLPQRVLR